MASKLPTVAIFVAHYPPMGGGIARLASTTFYGMGMQECNVIFVTPQYDDTQKKHEQLDEHVSIHRLPIYKSFGYKRYPIIKKNNAYKKTMHKLRNAGIDRVVVLTRFHLTSHVGADFGKANNIPVYLLECSGAPLTLRNTILDIPLRFTERALSKLIFKKIDHFYGMSQAARKFLLEEYGIKTKDSLWSCSIDTESAIVKHTDSSKIVITYCGRIENLKGEESLVNAFMDLVKDYDNLYLNFVGTGSYLKTLRANFKHENIVYWGQQNIGMINKINNESDISVCATTFPDGAVPNAVLEAGSQKCAMVCSPNGGFLEIIQDGVNGVLTDKSVTVPSMVASLRLLIENEEFRRKVSENIFVDISEKYNTKVVASRVLRDLNLK
jgi:glycosyltransferase involved in cell wall biosynthesis